MFPSMHSKWVTLVDMATEIHKFLPKALRAGCFRLVNYLNVQFSIVFNIVQVFDTDATDLLDFAPLYWIACIEKYISSKGIRK